MRVIARIRPFNEQEMPLLDTESRITNRTQHIKRVSRAAECVGSSIKFTESTRNIKQDIASRLFPFEAVLDNASQYTVYQESVRPLVQSLLQGISVTAFAYGATGCGKSHTMFGTREDPGVVVCAVKEIFEAPGENDLSMKMSYLEIYNEELRDLVPVDVYAAPLQLSVRETRGTIQITNSSEHVVRSLDEFLVRLQDGNSRRAVNSTLKNKTSSRSHAVLKLSLGQSTLTFVDLAGSEKCAGQLSSRAAEGTFINKSLLALAKCIHALVLKSQHVPYRESLLTRLLKDALGGKSQTVMIACLSPSSLDTYETRNTLEYAARIRSIRQKPARAPPPTAAQKLNILADLYKLALVDSIQQGQPFTAARLEQLVTTSLPSIAKSHSIRPSRKLVETVIQEMLQAAFPHRIKSANLKKQRLV